MNMIRYAIISNNEVSGIIFSEEDPKENWVETNDLSVEIGYLYDEATGEFTPKPVLSFAVVQNGQVTNIAIGTEPMHDSWVQYDPSETTVNVGDMYNEETGSFASNGLDKIFISEITDGTNDILLNDGILAIAEGTSTTFTIEVRNHKDEILPLTQEFVLPISGLHGSLSRSLLIEFIDGVATKTVSWPNSGIWEVTKNEINADIQGQGFDFIPLKIKVYE